MSQSLPIWIMEPEQAKKQELAARKLVERGPKATRLMKTVSIEELEQQIRGLRQHTRDNINSLVDELKTSLSGKYPGVRVKSAIDNIDAVTYITEISDGIDTVSTNNSSIIAQELKPGLVANGFAVINSYLNEFDITEKTINDYWDLPRLFEKDLQGSFDVALKMDSLPNNDTKKYLAVLGVNAISAEDSAVFFLEHSSNIVKDLRQASKVALVIGLDKIVKTREEAAFQSLCMGIFGMESLLLGMKPKPDGLPAIDNLPLPPGDDERELHVIILDNGRHKLLEGEFRDLFLCIGCRACNKHCPIRHSFAAVDYIWTPRTYLNQFLYGKDGSIDVCLHCESCHIECPLDIDLPHLMWQAKSDYIAGHGTSLKHKMLGRPEVLAKLGTAFAPLANWMMRQKLVRIPMETITGIDRRTTLPTFHHRTFRKWLKEHG